MRSPRFSFRENELKKIFSSGDLKVTWKNKVRIALRKSPLPDPIEHLDFHTSLDAECLKIERLVREGSYQPSPAKRILLEKSKGLCRQISIPALKDLIVLQRLSDALYADIKNKAPSKRSFFEMEDHSFSNQKKEEAGAPSYGGFRAWLNFQKMLLSFTKEREYLIITDVANYYDTISYTHLRNVIGSQIDIRETVLDTLIYVLSGLLWQPDYMPRVEIGLPQINIDATRILAHCFLYELDEYLESRGYDFTRFMDDIDIGVDTIIDARHILRDIDLILQTRQVRLNSGKTKILTSEQARLHFRVKENHVIDVALKRIEKKINAHESLARERRSIEKMFPKLYSGGRFDEGAGEKILKRMLTIARKVKARLKHKTIYHILLNRPACREPALKYLIDRKMNNKSILIIASFISNSQLVDDASILMGVEAIVEANMPRNDYTRKIIARLIKNLHGKKSFAATYALLWLLSKYGTSADIIKYARLTFDIWRVDPLLGRLVGGLMPIVKIDGRDSELYKLLDNARNPDAYAVASFHESLISDIKNFGAIRSIIAAENDTKPSGITHPKFLVLLSALQSTNLNAKNKLGLLKNHAKVRQDKYYRHRIVRALPATIRSEFFRKGAQTAHGNGKAVGVPANQNLPGAGAPPQHTAR